MIHDGFCYDFRVENLLFQLIQKTDWFGLIIHFSVWSSSVRYKKSYLLICQSTFHSGFSLSGDNDYNFSTCKVPLRWIRHCIPIQLFSRSDIRFQFHRPSWELYFPQCNSLSSFCYCNKRSFSHDSPLEIRHIFFQIVSFENIQSA